MGRIITRTECFEEGVRARRLGFKKADNPYDATTPERTEWEAGRSATYDLNEDSDPASDRDQSADNPDEPPVNVR